MGYYVTPRYWNLDSQIRLEDRRGGGGGKKYGPGLSEKRRSIRRRFRSKLSCHYTRAAYVQSYGGKTIAVRAKTFC